MQPGHQLPSEQTIVSIFGVSRPVVREALGSLEKSGHIVKIPRRGVFVAEEREAFDFAGTNLGLFAELEAKGHKVTTRTSELGRAQPTAREASLLNLMPGLEVVRLRRVYLIDGTPFALGNNSVPAGRVPGLEALDFENVSFYRTLREHYGLRVVRAERWLDATTVTAEQAAPLELPEGAPVLRVESIGWAEDGTPLEYYDSLYNTRLSRFHLSTAQPAEGGGAGP